MYWYKKPIYWTIATLLSCVLTSGCQPELKHSASALKYFDISGYFAKDIARLNKLDKSVTKTVMHNGKTETRTVHIKNWDSELQMFKDADINKPAWKDSYSVVSDSTFLLYRAKDPDLKVQEILIKRTGDKVKWILIFTRVQNFLYHTIAKLSYFPDSVYRIEMRQSVRLVGTNRYLVKGVLR